VSRGRTSPCRSPSPTPGRTSRRRSGSRLPRSRKRQRLQSGRPRSASRRNGGVERTGLESFLLTDVYLSWVFAMLLDRAAGSSSWRQAIS
jgi:hypothetical protein